MKGAEEYITREISRRGGRQFGRHQKALVVQYQRRRRRRTHLRTRPEDPLKYAIDDPAPQRSCPTVDEVLAKVQFLSPPLYQIHCIGPIGFGFAHISSERHPPNRDPTVIIIIIIKEKIYKPLNVEKIPYPKKLIFKLQTKSKTNSCKNL